MFVGVIVGGLVDGCENVHNVLFQVGGKENMKLFKSDINLFWTLRNSCSNMRIDS